MSVFGSYRPEDEQVNPFNAGEPTLPWEEPEPLGGEEPPDEHDTYDEPEYVAHGEKGGTPHKGEDNYQAPTTRGHDYDAPSIDGHAEPGPKRKAARPPRRTARPGGQAPAPPEATSGQRGRNRGCLIALIVVIIAFSGLGGAVVSCVSLLGESAIDGVGAIFEDDSGYDDLEDDSDSDDFEIEHEESEGQDDAAAAAVEGALTYALSSPESGALYEQLVSFMDEKISEIDGYTTSELGIDAGTWASWAIQNTSLSIDSVYTYDDGTGTVYVSGSAPDANSFMWALSDEYFGYLIDEGVGYGEPLSAENVAYVQDVFANMLESYQLGEGDVVYCGIDVTRQGDEWVVDDAALADAYEGIYLLY